MGAFSVLPVDKKQEETLYDNCSGYRKAFFKVAGSPKIHLTKQEEPYYCINQLITTCGAIVCSLEK
jgi:hypothetical protein